MVRQVLFAGGRRETVTILSGSLTESTDTSTFNTTYSDCSLRISGGFNVFKVDLYTETSGALSKTNITGSGNKLFVHAAIRYNGGTGQPTNRIIQLVDTSGFPWFSIRGAPGNTATFALFWNSGTGPSPVWTQFGGIAQTLPEGVTTWDIEFTFGTPHSVNLHLNRELWKSGTFTQASFTNVAEVHFAGLTSAGFEPTVFFSEILITENISTIGSFVRTSRPNAIGANTGFTNNNTAVNEVVVNDATTQVAASSSLITTHVMSDVVVPTGFNIETIFLWMRAKNDGTAPFNIRSVLRSGGINYSTPNISLISNSFSPVGARYNLDVLGIPWTEAEWNGIEAGYESAT